MNQNHRKIAVCIGGASGSMYAKILLDKLLLIPDVTVGVVMSENAKLNWKLEIGSFQAEDYTRFKFYEKNDFFAPFASGSAKYDTVIVCPCSMGLLARIAHGVSDDLPTRAADVALKERRKLILVPRETPYSIVHLQNMLSLSQAGAIICPATPSFYSNPKDMHSLLSTVVDRVLDLAGFDLPSYRWGESPL